jgi:hypothetical protein
MQLELYLDSNLLDPILAETVNDLKALAREGFLKILQCDENGNPAVFILTEKAFEFVEEDGSEHGFNVIE